MNLFGAHSNNSNVWARKRNKLNKPAAGDLTPKQDCNSGLKSAVCAFVERLHYQIGRRCHCHSRGCRKDPSLSQQHHCHDGSCLVVETQTQHRKGKSVRVGECRHNKGHGLNLNCLTPMQSGGRSPPHHRPSPSHSCLTISSSICAALCHDSAMVMAF